MSWMHMRRGVCSISASQASTTCLRPQKLEIVPHNAGQLRFRSCLQGSISQIGRQTSQPPVEIHFAFAGDRSAAVETDCQAASPEAAVILLRGAGQKHNNLAVAWQPSPVLEAVVSTDQPRGPRRAAPGTAEQPGGTMQALAGHHSGPHSSSAAAGATSRGVPTDAGAQLPEDNAHKAAAAADLPATAQCTSSEHPTDMDTVEELELEAEEPRAGAKPSCRGAEGQSASRLGQQQDAEQGNQGTSAQPGQPMASAEEVYGSTKQSETMGALPGSALCIQHQLQSGPAAGSMQAGTQQETHLPQAAAAAPEQCIHALACKRAAAVAPKSLAAGGQVAAPASRQAACAPAPAEQQPGTSLQGAQSGPESGFLNAQPTSAGSVPVLPGAAAPQAPVGSDDLPEGPDSPSGPGGAHARRGHSAGSADRWQETGDDVAAQQGNEHRPPRSGGGAGPVVPSRGMWMLLMGPAQHDKLAASACCSCQRRRCLMIFTCSKVSH